MAVLLIKTHKYCSYVWILKNDAEDFISDENNGYTSRFLGFSISISNTTNKNEGVLCFKDKNQTRATIPNPVNITCRYHGRYIIYYNDRIQQSSPVGYSSYAYNELCEVKVYGKFARRGLKLC